MLPNQIQAVALFHSNDSKSLQFATCRNPQCSGLFQDTQDFGRRAALGSRPDPYEPILVSRPRNGSALLLQRAFTPDFRSFEQV
jgi:hypothetical protein